MILIPLSHTPTTYYILDGRGTYFIKNPETGEFERIPVGKEEGRVTITIPPNTEFYYESDLKEPLKMIERMTPNYQDGNVVVISPTPYMINPPSLENKDQITL